MSLKRSGNGSSFFEYCTNACIFSSRPIERNSLNTRSIDGGIPDAAGALSMRGNLITFRGPHHHEHGEKDANEKSDCSVGRWAESGQGIVQDRERRDRWPVQFHFAVREWGWVQSRRAARRC